MGQSSKTILLVERDSLLSSIEEQWLLNEGFHIVQAASGQEAVDIVRRSNIDPIDLVLMDIDPGMDGVSAAREILKDHDIPLIFLTSHTEPEFIANTEQITSYGYVLKGSGRSILLASINMAFRLHTTYKEKNYLFESAYDAILIFEPESEVILEANNRACAIYGFSKDEITGLSLKQLSRNVSRGEEHIHKLLENGHYEEFETEQIRKDGRAINFLINASVIEYNGRPAILTMNRDITERHRVEKLTIIQRDLYLFLNSTTDLMKALNQVLETCCSVEPMDCGGLYLVSPETGELNMANQKGLSPEFAASVSHFPADSPNAKLVASGKPIFGQYQEIMGNQDDLKIREGLKTFAVLPVFHESRLIAVFNLASHKNEDIPESVRNFFESLTLHIGATLARLSAYEENQRMNIKLKELNSTKDKLFSIIAHDLRGPFSGFLGLTEILAANLDGMEKEEIETCGKVMHSTAKKIFQLLTNLLDWSRLQSDKIELKPMDLNVCAEVENIISLYSTAAENKSILLENNCDKQMWIKSDQNMFSTILRNLISNAVKFTGTGGRISMESKVKNNFVEISVTDSGVGMTQEAMDKVFRIDSGYTTLGTNNEEGTGLGLVLCKELIEKNGGQISVESVPDKGTTFNVKLPAVKMKTEKLMNDTIDS